MLVNASCTNASTVSLHQVDDSCVSVRVSHKLKIERAGQVRCFCLFHGMLRKIDCRRASGWQGLEGVAGAVAFAGRAASELQQSRPGMQNFPPGGAPGLHAYDSCISVFSSSKVASKEIALIVLHS